MTPSTTVPASVFDNDGRCIGFVLKRGSTAERSLGKFENEKRAALKRSISAAQNSFFQPIGRSPDEKPGRTVMQTRQKRIEHDGYRRARHCAQG